MYSALARVYPNIGQVHTIATKEQGTFAAVSLQKKSCAVQRRSLFAKDDNVGLLRLVVERAPRWAIRKLTETYLTLSLPEIGRAAGIEDVEEVRRIVLSMVRSPENLYTGSVPTRFRLDRDRRD